MSEESVDQQDTLYKIRHSLAHVLAQAVLELRPEAKLAFGPPVENGFYYDFDFNNNPIGEVDLSELEERMRRIIKEKIPFQQKFLSPEEGIALLEKMGQNYKVEYAKELVEQKEIDPRGLSFFQHGTFVDMCEGPHVNHTGELPKDAFKLDRISGSYWRGSEKNPMLTRIYGFAFLTKSELEDFLHRRQLAMERDHRKLGEELDLFIQDPEVGVGLPLWAPNGTVIREELEKWAKEEEFKAGYSRVSTPCITRAALYYRSGHLPYYEESMYPPMTLDENDQYYLRPMNCPHHHKIYASRLHSYRDLPIRLAEYGNVFRYEKHGSLSGLLRVRAMCMNDAHIYCTLEQVESEFVTIMQMYDRYYQHLRLGNFRVRLSLHDPNSDKFVANEELWNRSEDMSRQVLNDLGIPYEEEKGEAAFYGPKVDVQVKNLMGREETVSTCQLDFVMSERFDLTFIDQDGQPKRPYIIHRAPLSTHERIISFLIEFYGGAFPTWLAPIQIMVVPVNPALLEYATAIKNDLHNQFFRVEIDDSTETFNKKIRNAVVRKIPNIWVLGEREKQNQSITWRRYAVKEQITVPLSQAIVTLEQLRQKRIMDNFADIPLPL